MVGRWITAGGLHRQRDGATRFPAGLVFGHFGLAAAGLVLWIVYLALDIHVLTWVALVLLVVVALLGFTLFARWLPTRRPAAAVPASLRAGASRHGGDVRADVAGADPDEGHLPVPVVATHGLFAVASLVLVLLAALGVGG
jgi:hypothetical protein